MTTVQGPVTGDFQGKLRSQNAYVDLTFISLSLRHRKDKNIQNCEVLRYSGNMEGSILIDDWLLLM